MTDGHGGRFVRDPRVLLFGDLEQILVIRSVYRNPFRYVGPSPMYQYSGRPSHLKATAQKIDAREMEQEQCIFVIPIVVTVFE